MKEGTEGGGRGARDIDVKCNAWKWDHMRYLQMVRGPSTCGDLWAFQEVLLNSRIFHCLHRKVHLQERNCVSKKIDSISWKIHSKINSYSCTLRHNNALERRWMTNQTIPRTCYSTFETRWWWTRATDYQFGSREPSLQRSLQPHCTQIPEKRFPMSISPDLHHF